MALGCQDGMRAMPTLTTCVCVHAGMDRKAACYVHVPGVTPKQPRPHSNNRGQVKALVFINRAAGAYVKLCTGTTSLRGLYTPPEQPYLLAKGKPASSMTRDEYADGLEAAVQHFRLNKDFEAQKGHWKLLQDGARTHLKPGQHQLKAQGPDCCLDVMTQPPRSPDIMPLDYAVFGLAKRALKAKFRSNWEWPARAAEFVRLLRESDVKAAIDGYPNRLQRLDAAGGGHFE